MEMVELPLLEPAHANFVMDCLKLSDRGRGLERGGPGRAGGEDGKEE